MSSTRVEKPNKLVVMSWAGGWGKALKEAVSIPFTELTGIPVHHEINIGLKLPRGLMEALESNTRPPFDVVWSNSVPAMRLAQQDACIPLSEEAVPRLKDLGYRAHPEGFRDWAMVLPYVTQYVLVYRDAVFPDQRPDSWEVMLEPRFKGKVALYPGGNGFYPIAQLLGGGTVAEIPEDMTACWEYFRKLRPQVSQLDYSIGMGQLIRNEVLDLCFRALPNALAFRGEGLDVSWVAPREGVPDTGDALWIPKNVPDDIAFWAMQYINFSLGPEVQERWCEMLGVLPVHPEARPGEVFRGDSHLPRSSDDLSRVLYVPDVVKMRYELEWEAKFNEIFLSGLE